MKKTLAHLPREKISELKKIITIIRQLDCVEMVILFGSFARGNWVDDMYKDNHVTYSYKSDYDLLIVVKEGKSAKRLGIWSRLEERLRRHGAIQRLVTLVVHDINFINRDLSDGQYFFTDIKREGIMLYDTKKFKLARARKLSNKERKAFAIDDFKVWFKSAKSFYKNFQFSLGIKEYKTAAFQLHQAVERFYMTMLLVFTKYKPKIHDLTELGKQVSGLEPAFLKVFPRSTPEEERLFDLLKRAYIDARYKKSYRITKDELLYLSGRVRKLQRLTKKVCQVKIENF